VNRMRKHLSPATVISCVALFLALGGGAYAATQIAKKSVKTKHLGNGSVTTQKLRNGAVTSPKLRNGAVTGAKIGSGAVGGTQIADGAVRAVDLGGGVVTSAKLQNGAVTDAKLANNAVTTSKLNADAVTTGKIGNEAVTGAKLSASILDQLLRNVSYETKASASNSDSPKDATATCPTGKVAIGGGAKLTLGSAIGVALGESAPTPPDGQGRRTGWVATAHEVVGGEAEAWSVEAYVVCAEL
jgi:hypothetical protein